jgi:hypothetical protein
MFSRKRLRFTGCWPPIDLWERFPNWAPAVEEEGRRDQDETTLRPAETQDEIDDETVLTAGHVHQANGIVLPALIHVHDDRPFALTAFVQPDDGWELQQKGKTFEWIPVVQDWLPPEERSPAISFDTPGVFPIRVFSRLPLATTRKQIVFVVREDGVCERG